MNIESVQASLVATPGGTSQVVSISGTSAQSTALGRGYALVTPTVDCFFRVDSNPTALSDGTDQFLLAGNQYRITGLGDSVKFAFKTSGATGFVYITPGA